MTLSPRAIEVGARALCIAAGDDPDKMTYAHEMACTGRDREPKYRWQYWAEFAGAAICAALAAGDSSWCRRSRRRNRLLLRSPPIAAPRWTNRAMPMFCLRLPTAPLPQSVHEQSGGER